jgi:hypothetical protein
MRWFSSWWSTVPEWAKPPLLVAGLGIIAWIVVTALPYLKQRIYIAALRDLDDTKREVLLAAIKSGQSATNLKIVDLNPIIEKASFPRWIIRRAMQWEADRKRFG